MGLALLVSLTMVLVVGAIIAVDVFVLLMSRASSVQPETSPYLGGRRALSNARVVGAATGLDC